MLKSRHSPVGPLHSHRGERIAWAYAERQHIVAARLKSTRGLELLVEHAAVIVDRDFGADREAIRSLTVQLDLQKVRFVRTVAGVVPVDERGVVDVVHDEIERAVAV